MQSKSDAHTCCYLSLADSPSCATGWLDTVGPSGCSGLIEPQTGRRDSSLHPSPRSFDELQNQRRAIYFIIYLMHIAIWFECDVLECLKYYTDVRYTLLIKKFRNIFFERSGNSINL